MVQAVREDEKISGILIGNTEHKICLYVNDILMTLTKPKISLPKLLLLLKEFGQYDGYKLNLHKTQTLIFNHEPYENIYRTCQFKNTVNTIKYLGVQIPKDFILFIWGKQKPQIRFQTLQLPKDKGGMALPCVEDYYKAAQLRFLVCWCYPECDTKWKDSEQNLCM